MCLEFSSYYWSIISQSQIHHCVSVTKPFCHREELIGGVLHNSVGTEVLRIHLSAAIWGHQPVKLLGGTLRITITPLFSVILLAPIVFFSTCHITIWEWVTVIAWAWGKKERGGWRRERGRKRFVERAETHAEPFNLVSFIFSLNDMMCACPCWVCVMNYEDFLVIHSMRLCQQNIFMFLGVFSCLCSCTCASANA